MASRAVCAQSFRAPLVVSSGIALKGASPSALRIRAATQRVGSGGGTRSAKKQTRCQAEGEGQTQTIKNETISVNKVPLQSKEMMPKLDDGAGGFPPKDGDGGGGGGGGGGGWGQGGFVFWALVLLVGFLRDRELEKPYQIKPKKIKRRSMA